MVTLTAPSSADGATPSGMTRRRKRISADPVPARVESLDHEGRGLAWIEGKLVVVDGALPGEQVMLRYRRRRARFDEASVVEVCEAAPERVQPRCPHFGICGGCSLQHLDSRAQLRFKEARLVETLAHHAGVEPEETLPPLSGGSWGYRRKARLGARYVQKKNSLLVGFRERGSSFVADLSRCDILHPAVGRRVDSLRRVVGSLEAAREIPQIELAAGDDSVALVFRHLVPLADKDRQALREFAVQHGYRIYLQSGGLQTVTPIHPPGPDQGLSYRLADWDVEIRFQPTDFAQVNAEMNRLMVTRALELLEVEARDRVLDLFCGLGNFTLPLARRAAHVLGVEADAGLVARARENARINGIGNAEFLALDLSSSGIGTIWRGGDYDKLLLDPPRNGAEEVIASMRSPYPSRLVYVSCNAATFARDAAELVRHHNYRLRCIGVVDIFPHTSHAESIALFDR